MNGGTRVKFFLLKQGLLGLCLFFTCACSAQNQAIDDLDRNSEQEAPNYSWLGTVGEGLGVLINSYSLPAGEQWNSLERLQDASAGLIESSKKSLIDTGCLGASLLRVKLQPGLGTCAATRLWAFPLIPYVLIDPIRWNAMNENQRHMTLHHEFGHLYYCDNAVAIALLSGMPLVLWGVGRFVLAPFLSVANNSIYRRWQQSVHQRRLRAARLIAYKQAKRTIPGFKRGSKIVKRLRRSVAFDWVYKKTGVILGIYEARNVGDACTLFLGRVAFGYWLGSKLFGRGLSLFWDKLGLMHEWRADRFAIAHARSAEDILQRMRYFDDYDKEWTDLIINRYAVDWIRAHKKQRDPEHPLPEERIALCRKALERFK